MSSTGLHPSGDSLAVPRAWGVPPLRSASLRERAEDFTVEEEVGIAPTGDGEHLWLLIEKRGVNTEAAARELAAAARVSRRAVSYAGLKDRHALARQWFSVQLPAHGGEQIVTSLPPEIRVLHYAWHRRKLRRGALAGNCFVVVLKDVTGDRDGVLERIEWLSRRGVPNYFGEQRFGRRGGNLERAEAYLRGETRVRDRQLRSYLLSAARAQIFNAVLASRVADGSWDRLLPGEAVMLAGTRSFFLTESVDEQLQRRLREADLHPSGPLWGRGGTQAGGEVAALERRVAHTHASLARGLEACDMAPSRRPLRVIPDHFRWQWSGAGELTLRFRLPAGAFATAVLRELADYRDHQRNEEPGCQQET